MQGIQMVVRGGICRQGDNDWPEFNWQGTQAQSNVSWFFNLRLLDRLWSQMGRGWAQCWSNCWVTYSADIKRIAQDLMRGGIANFCRGKEYNGASYLLRTTLNTLDSFQRSDLRRQRVLGQVYERYKQGRGIYQALHTASQANNIAIPVYDMNLGQPEDLGDIEVMTGHLFQLADTVSRQNHPSINAHLVTALGLPQECLALQTDFVQHDAATVRAALRFIQKASQIGVHIGHPELNNIRLALNPLLNDDLEQKVGLSTDQCLQLYRDFNINKMRAWLNQVKEGRGLGVSGKALFLFLLLAPTAALNAAVLTGLVSSVGWQVPLFLANLSVGSFVGGFAPSLWSFWRGFASLFPAVAEVIAGRELSMDVDGSALVKEGVLEQKVGNVGLDDEALLGGPGALEAGGVKAGAKVDSADALTVSVSPSLKRIRPWNIDMEWLARQCQAKPELQGCADFFKRLVSGVPRAAAAFVYGYTAVGLVQAIGQANSPLPPAPTNSSSWPTNTSSWGAGPSAGQLPVPAFVAGMNPPVFYATCVALVNMLGVKNVIDSVLSIVFSAVQFAWVGAVVGWEYGRDYGVLKDGGHSLLSGGNPVRMACGGVVGGITTLLTATAVRFVANINPLTARRKLLHGGAFEAGWTLRCENVGRRPLGKAITEVFGSDPYAVSDATCSKDPRQFSPAVINVLPNGLNYLVAAVLYLVGGFCGGVTAAALTACSLLQRVWGCMAVAGVKAKSHCWTPLVWSPGISSAGTDISNTLRGMLEVLWQGGAHLHHDSEMAGQVATLRLLLLYLQRQDKTRVIVQAFLDKLEGSSLGVAPSQEEASKGDSSHNRDPREQLVDRLCRVKGIVTANKRDLAALLSSPQRDLSYGDVTSKAVMNRLQMRLARLNGYERLLGNLRRKIEAVRRCLFPSDDSVHLENGRTDVLERQQGLLEGKQPVAGEREEADEGSTPSPQQDTARAFSKFKNDVERHYVANQPGFDGHWRLEGKWESVPSRCRVVSAVIVDFMILAGAVVSPFMLAAPFSSAGATNSSSPAPSLASGEKGWVTRVWVGALATCSAILIVLNGLKPLLHTLGFGASYFNLFPGLGAKEDLEVGGCCDNMRANELMGGKREPLRVSAKQVVTNVLSVLAVALTVDSMVDGARGQLPFVASSWRVDALVAGVSTLVATVGVVNAVRSIYTLIPDWISNCGRRAQQGYGYDGPRIQRAMEQRLAGRELAGALDCISRPVVVNGAFATRAAGSLVVDGAIAVRNVIKPLIIKPYVTYASKRSGFHFVGWLQALWFGGLNLKADPIAYKQGAQRAWNHSSQSYQRDELRGLLKNYDGYLGELHKLSIDFDAVEKEGKRPVLESGGERAGGVSHPAPTNHQHAPAPLTDNVAGLQQLIVSSERLIKTIEHSLDGVELGCCPTSSDGARRHNLKWLLTRIKADLVFARKLRGLLLDRDSAEERVAADSSANVTCNRVIYGALTALIAIGVDGACRGVFKAPSQLTYALWGVDALTGILATLEGPRHLLDFIFGSLPRSLFRPSKGDGCQPERGDDGHPRQQNASDAGIAKNYSVLRAVRRAVMKFAVCNLVAYSAMVTANSNSSRQFGRSLTWGSIAAAGSIVGLNVPVNAVLSAGRGAWDGVSLGARVGWYYGREKTAGELAQSTWYAACPNGLKNPFYDGMKGVMVALTAIATVLIGRTVAMTLGSLGVGLFSESNTVLSWSFGAPWGKTPAVAGYPQSFKSEEQQHSMWQLMLNRLSDGFTKDPFEKATLGDNECGLTRALSCMYNAVSGCANAAGMGVNFLAVYMARVVWDSMKLSYLTLRGGCKEWLFWKEAELKRVGASAVLPAYVVTACLMVSGVGVFSGLLWRGILPAAQAAYYAPMALVGLPGAYVARLVKDNLDPRLCYYYAKQGWAGQSPLSQDGEGWRLAQELVLTRPNPNLSVLPAVVAIVTYAAGLVAAGMRWLYRNPCAPFALFAALLVGAMMPYYRFVAEHLVGMVADISKLCCAANWQLDEDYLFGSNNSALFGAGLLLSGLGLDGLNAVASWAVCAAVGNNNVGASVVGFMASFSILDLLLQFVGRALGLASFKEQRTQLYCDAGNSGVRGELRALQASAIQTGLAEGHDGTVEAGRSGWGRLGGFASFWTPSPRQAVTQALTNIGRGRFFDKVPSSSSCCACRSELTLSRAGRLVSEGDNTFAIDDGQTQGKTH